jgi:hypothetical protein
VENQIKIVIERIVSSCHFFYFIVDFVFLGLQLLVWVSLKFGVPSIVFDLEFC